MDRDHSACLEDAEFLVEMEKAGMTPAQGKNKTKSTFQFVSDPSGLFSDKIGMVHVKGNPFDGSNITRIGKVLVNSQGTFLWSHFTENSRVRLSSSVLLKTIKSTIEKL